MRQRAGTPHCGDRTAATRRAPADKRWRTREPHREGEVCNLWVFVLHPAPNATHEFPRAFLLSKQCQHARRKRRWRGERHTHFAPAVDHITDTEIHGPIRPDEQLTGGILDRSAELGLRARRKQRRWRVRPIEGAGGRKRQEQRQYLCHLRVKKIAGLGNELRHTVQRATRHKPVGLCRGHKEQVAGFGAGDGVVFIRSVID